MPVSEYFAETYGEARHKFLLASMGASAETTTYILPKLRGPGGEELAVDVAVLGPENPDSVLLLVSATHGIEGFCGSGCQVGYFSDKLYEALPAHTRTISIHALNPYGFAWFRRVNEDNVDLNRNFQAFPKVPAAPAYEEIHDWLVPAEWEGPHREAADASLQEYIVREGMSRFQAAVSGGQYSRPTGLFYGGEREVWSNRTFRQILSAHIPVTVKNVVVLDFHTGLGPTGYGEPIFVGPYAEGLDKAKKLFGSEVTSTSKGDAVSAPITGALPEAFKEFPYAERVMHIALEFGTQTIPQVLTALRADHWLHAIPERETDMRDEIRQQIKDAFYVNTPAWKAAVYGQARGFAMRAARALATR